VRSNIRHVRPKMCCTRCDTIIQAEAPRQANRSWIGRTGPAGARAGVEVRRSSSPLSPVGDLCPPGRGTGSLDHGYWWGQPANLLSPLVDQLRKHVLAAGSCTPTIRRLRCWLPVPVRRRRAGYGPMCETVGSLSSLLASAYRLIHLFPEQTGNAWQVSISPRTSHKMTLATTLTATVL
jgi:hypothetical protein